jgi:hypothetical protein
MFMKEIALFAILLSLSISLPVLAQKTVYIPKSITNTGMDLNKSSSQWCYCRSKESDNVVVFWEAGFGNDPSTASDNYRVNMNTLLQLAEKAYSFYLDSLKFASKGSSVTDKYKLMIFLLYSTDWVANGSGEDNLVQSLRVNPAAAKDTIAISHEIGHCFQYITSCDGVGGFRYGFGENGSGGNGFWEQCAQWMTFKIYPAQQFPYYLFSEYLKSNHLHILHEDPRYANYFIQDYWTYKHGITFIGKLWIDSRSPEDPVEAYKRLNSISQTQFNDEMFEHASRLTTWDLPALKSYGKNYMDRRGQMKMNLTSDKYWLIDTSMCIQNYGYNCIKLNAPLKATDVTVHFQGKTGAPGFRAINTGKGGWRFGFVALLKDSTRIYSDMGTANVLNGNNPDQSLTFSCPANCSKLWLVVSGAPQEHWKHPWDNNYSNDEQWPYQVQFKNTNLLGEITQTLTPMVKNGLKRIDPVISNRKIYLSEKFNWQITSLSGRQIKSGYGKSIDINGFSNGGYILRYSGKNFRIEKSFVKTF